MTRFVYVLPAGRFRWEVRQAEANPRVARSLDELRVGQVVAWRNTDEPWHEAALLAIRDKRALLSSEWGEGVEVIIISDPESKPQPLYYRRKAHALIAARAIAIIIGGEVQPHDRRGRIQDPDSYGPDPRESAG